MKELALTVPGGHTLNPVAGMPSGGTSTLQSIVSLGTTILFISAIILALFFLIWGGITWITSGGDKAGVESARKKIIYAVIGLIITLASFMIINIVGTILGADLFG